jgi:hypothetical protein
MKIAEKEEHCREECTSITKKCFAEFAVPLLFVCLFLLEHYGFGLMGWHHIILSQGQYEILPHEGIYMSTKYLVLVPVVC